VVKSADEVGKEGAQDWDTQFWINLSEAVPTGAKLHVEFDYAASKAAKGSTQAHGAPGAYQHWAAIGDVNFTTEWQHFSADITVDDAMAKGDNGNGNGIGVLSIAFNLAVERTATEYYFDNFGVWYQKPVVPDSWTDLIVNGSMEDKSLECFYVTEQGVGGPFVAIATDGIGKDGSKAVKVQSADNPAQDWDSQFFIRLPYQLPAGTKYRLSFDYKADKAGDFDTQAHAEPGQYIHWAMAGSGSFTTEWQTYEKEGTVPAECDGSESKNEAGEVLFLKTFQTIAFNLAKNKVATEFIFDNVKFEVPTDVAATLVANPAVNPTPYPVPEVAHTWNFTKWSEATVANLKADAAASKLEGWSDVEKKADAEADGDPTDISKDNCFWATIAEGGELTANGVAIEELKGLEFNATYSVARSLAIAVNYPSTSLGDYNGGAYLWLGGGGKDVDCFVIKNVKLGTEISMGVETHKIGDARGVQLFIRNADGSRGDMLKDPAGNEVAAPTAYAEQTWAVPAGEGVVNVIVYNTKGCHIYFIDAEIGEAPEPVIPEDPELEAPEGWTSAITNGNLAGDDVTSFVSKEYPSADIVGATIAAGAGKNESRGIVVKAGDDTQNEAAQAWDSQFWIQLNTKLTTGAKLHVEFDYKASQAAKATTQSHSNPGNYLHWAMIGDVNFTTEWQHFSADVDITDAMAKGDNGNGNGDGVYSIAFNLQEEKSATDYYFDNFGVWYKTAETVGIETVKVAQKADVIYNLRGQKVNKAEKGLFIINGKKVVK
jgi:hypothetical protein